MALGSVHLINNKGQTWWSNDLKSWKMRQPPHLNPSQQRLIVVGSSSLSSFLAFNLAIASSLGLTNFSLQLMDGSIMFQWITHFKLQLPVTSALGQVAQRLCKRSKSFYLKTLPRMWVQQTGRSSTRKRETWCLVNVKPSRSRLPVWPK